ncbi:hypothetical protein DPMN_193760 [Dreissena polymorpha]|uniref:Uncharacterized protein n=1 Tax=Dreissena polymorpha TaxID=45954 RepID=A0A9D4B5X6_DREPO|nr:hypothetical protein DPMN_193760 [Dreissena polymorpha]
MMPMCNPHLLYPRYAQNEDNKQFRDDAHCHTMLLCNKTTTCDWCSHEAKDLHNDGNSTSRCNESANQYTRYVYYALVLKDIHYAIIMLR